MRTRATFVLVAGVLLAAQWDRSTTAGEPVLTAPEPAVLTTSEEANPAGGRRVRVSTPTVRINDFQGSLTLRLDCMHPVERRAAPDQCLVNIIHRDIQAKYSLERSARFRISADNKMVFDGQLQNLGTRKEGPEVVEPLIGFWSFTLVKQLAASQNVAFLIETIPGEAHKEPAGAPPDSRRTPGPLRTPTGGSTPPSGKTPQPTSGAPSEPLPTATPIERDKTSVDKKCLAVLQEMVKYFQ